MGDSDEDDDENDGEEKREEKREGPEKLKRITTTTYSPGGLIQAPDFFRLGKNTYRHRSEQIRWLARSKNIDKVVSDSDSDSVNEEDKKGKKRGRAEGLEDCRDKDTKKRKPSLTESGRHTQRKSCVIC